MYSACVFKGFYRLWFSREAIASHSFGAYMGVRTCSHKTIYATKELPKARKPQPVCGVRFLSKPCLIYYILTLNANIVQRVKTCYKIKIAFRDLESRFRGVLRKRIRDAAFFLIIMLVTFAATLLKPQNYVSSRTIQKCVEHVSTST